MKLTQTIANQPVQLCNIPYKDIALTGQNRQVGKGQPSLGSGCPTLTVSGLAQPSNQPLVKKERSHDAHRKDKRAHPERYNCACGQPGAVFKNNDVICSRCIKLEEFHYRNVLHRHRYTPPQRIYETNIPDRFNMGDSLRFLDGLMRRAGVMA